MEKDKLIKKAFSELSREAVQLYIGSRIETIDLDNLGPDSPPFSALKFCRDYVNKNKPLKIKNGFNHWPAYQDWNEKTLQRIVGDQVVTVAVTPDGYADAVTGGVFMLPDEQQMIFSKFVELLNKDTDEVYYIQKQNSNLTTELERLWSDVDEQIPWATEAFGIEPDAVNFWMGGCRAVTSMHLDHYENIYCVVRGAKTFTIIPPTDQCYVPYDTVDVLRYKQLADGTFSKVKDPDYDSLPWIPVNPLAPDMKKYPEFANAHVYQVTVNEGEMLYLPSLWYHHVTQTDGCIAVNYWYDMQYDIKYNYHQMVGSLLQRRQLPVEDSPVDDC